MGRIGALPGLNTGLNSGLNKGNAVSDSSKRLGILTIGCCTVALAGSLLWFSSAPRGLLIALALMLILPPMVLGALKVVGRAGRV